MTHNLKNQLWVGSEDSFLELKEIEARILATPAVDLSRISAQSLASAAEAEDSEDFDGYGYMVSRVDNLAMVNIAGPLVTKNRPYNQFFGVVSYDEIRNAIYAAANDSKVDAIILHMQTPGGAASGISDVGEFIRKVDSQVKPVYTFTDTVMASGGYWLGSYGREIYASKLATVGSIGVITMHASLVEMLKKAGVEVTVIRKGEFKALGSPYEKLDDKARAQIEGQMDQIYDVFLSTVSENRGIVVSTLKDNAAEGRIFSGAQAVSVGLVDHVEFFDAAITAIAKKHTSTTGLQHAQLINSNTGVTIMGTKKVLTDAGVAAIAEGASEEEVLAQEGMTAEEEETSETNVEGSTEETTEVSETEETEAEVSEEQTADAGATNMKLLDKCGELQIEVAALKAELKTSEAAKDAAVSHVASLTEIAVQSTNKMQIALGGVALKLGDVTPDVVIETHSKVANSFNQRFRAGARAESVTDSDLEEEVAERENSSVAAAASRLTTHRK